MEEPTPDMLPDQSETEPVVTPTPTETVREDVQTPVSEHRAPQEDAPEAPDEPAVPQGHVPYSRFKEVNEKLKQTEAKLKDLEASSVPHEEETVDVTEETHNDVDSLRTEVWELKIDKVISQNPDLSDKREELEDYIRENKNLTFQQAVTLFRADHGLGMVSPRKGLEKPVTGQKTAPRERYTLEEIDHMREHDPKRWVKLHEEGAFDKIVKW